MQIRLGLLALAYALHELKMHAHEEGSNWGATVAEYLRVAGINSPASWCAAFDYWCLSMSCSELKIANPLGGVHYHALVQSFVDFAVAHDLTVPAGLAEPGDFVAYSFGEAGHFDHIGILKTPVKTDAFRAIEGNSNSNGSREGTEVVDHPRTYKINRTIFIAYDKYLPLYEVADDHELIPLLAEYKISL
jgi:hypothetical protein